MSGTLDHVTRTQTETIERTETETQHGSGQGSVAHIAEKSSLAEAYVNGTPVVALCGYTWVPSKSPKGLPVCAACKELAGMAWGDDAERISF
jgi:hypothetical protein